MGDLMQLKEKIERLKEIEKEIREMFSTGNDHGFSMFIHSGIEKGEFENLGYKFDEDNALDLGEVIFWAKRKNNV